jgi:hypothetical protein
MILLLAIQRVMVGAQKAKLSLSLPSTSVIDRTAQQVSARTVEYDATDTGVMLSIPVTSKIPHAVNNNGTYHDGYDSDGEIGPLFDAVAAQADGNDKGFYEEERVPEESAQTEAVVDRTANLSIF